MARQIFDQAELKSAKAQRFADAFAGCEEWVDLPRRSRGPDHAPGELEQQPVDVGLFDQQLDLEPFERRGRAA